MSGALAQLCPPYTGGRKEMVVGQVVLSGSGDPSLPVVHYWRDQTDENAVLTVVFECHSDADDYTNLAEMLATSTRQETEPPESMWRGVFAVQYERREIFTQRVELRVSELPRWRPQVIIPRRTLEAPDE